MVTGLASRMDTMNNIQVILWILMSIVQGVFIGPTAVGVHQFLSNTLNLKIINDMQVVDITVKEAEKIYTKTGQGQ